jgi:hypothetical protein
MGYLCVAKVGPTCAVLSDYKGEAANRKGQAKKGRKDPAPTLGRSMLPYRKRRVHNLRELRAQLVEQGGTPAQLCGCYERGAEVRRPGRSQHLWVGMSFPEFAEAVCRIPDERSDPDFRSQHVVACGKGRQKRLLADFVGRFENLEEDFVHVAERIGVGLELPHLLSTAGGRSYQDFYDRKLASMGGERYRLDAEIFSNSFSIHRTVLK